jgi:hypothetical protein
MTQPSAAAAAAAAAASQKSRISSQARFYSATEE